MIDPKLFERLEAMGVEAVREQLNLGKVSRTNPQHYEAVRSWVEGKDREDATASASRKEAREEESLSISRTALSNSRWALIIATSAVIISAIANRDHIASFVIWILQ